MTLADDCEKLIQVLADAPKTGLTMTELSKHTGWSLLLVNDILCALGKNIQFTKAREQGKKITRYSLRNTL